MMNGINSSKLSIHRAVFSARFMIGLVAVFLCVSAAHAVDDLDDKPIQSINGPDATPSGYTPGSPGMAIDLGSITITGHLVPGVSVGYIAATGLSVSSTAPAGSGGGGGGAGRGPSSEPVKEDPPSQNNSKEKCGEKTEHPVLLSTGEKVLPQVDAQLANIYGFAVERNYRSQNAAGNAFGPNWLSSLDGPRITWSGWVCDVDNLCAPQFAYLTEASGAQYQYQGIPMRIGQYRSTGSAAMGFLTYSAGGKTWTLNREKLVYSFLSTGALNTIKTSAGTPIRSNTYTSGRLSSFTIGTGSTFAVTWTNGLVTEVKDPSLKIWRYGYDTNGMLTTVTSPGAGSEIDIRTYHYENTADPTLLTGLSINDVRYSTYSYYTDKRVKESGLSDGQEKDTIVYSGNTTTVTDARGEKTTYTFTDVLGELRATSISRAATTTCAAAAAKTFYDTNGYPDYTLDWNNNKTDYTYAPDGLLSSITTAAARPLR
jgi:YD repeat-containing protein